MRRPVRNVKVFDPEVTLPVAAALSPLRVPATRRPKVAAEIRKELYRYLQLTALAAGQDYRLTGAARNAMRAGVRVFGTTFGNIRGHIMGPSYIIRQEEGGTITPTRAKKLAIPIFDGVRPDGSPKLPSPRSWSNIRKTFIYKSKITGKSYIAYKEGDSLRILYVLVDFAEVEPRGKLAEAWQRNSFGFMASVGQIMVTEMARFDFVDAAGIRTKGRRR